MTTRAEHNRKQYLKNREKRLAIQKAYYAANKEARNAYNKEYAEKNKATISEKRKTYRLKNLESHKESLRQWYLTNAEYAKQKAKEYRIANKDKLTEWAKEYRKIRMSNDPVYKAAIRVRALINIKLYANGYTKKSRAHEILGCSFADFTAYIEAQFAEGMSWSNHGEWHLDHKTPIALAQTEEEVIRLNHHTNFQPLWAIDNLKKGAKIVSQ
jgi:hypothetical protein